MIDQLVRKPILKISEVNWGDVPVENGTRLLWGENPFAPKESVQAIKEEAKRVNFYPSPTKANLKKGIANYNCVSPENIILTNGSDEAIELISKVFISEKDEVVIPVPTFPVYESTSLMMGARIKRVPLEKDFTLDTGKLLNAITSETKMIWISNPNNPTGNILLTFNQIKDLAKRLSCLLILDECYFELSGITAASLIDKYPNIAIIRSFSKIFGLAGARIGYIVANEKTASYLNKVLSANQVFNVNRFAQAAAGALFKDENRIKQLTNVYVTQKENFEKLLSQIKNIKIIPTLTTFCLLRLASEKINSSELKKKLKEKNIYIKDCYMYKLLGPEYVYLGVPAPKYQRYVADIMKKIMEEKTC